MWRIRSNRKSLVENRTMRMGGWLLVLAIFGAGAVLSPPVFAADKQLTFMSGGAKGSWYRYLTAMSECMRKNSDINVTVVPTSGGMEAFRKLQGGKADVGFTFQTVAFPAWQGKGSWKGKKHRELRAVGFGISSSIFHFVVLKSSGIKKLADLSGKKFSPCPIGTTCYASVGSFLKHIGLYKKIRVSNLSHGEQVSYLKDGKIDGYALQGGLPNPSVTEAALSRPVRLISVDQGVDFSGFLKEFPGFEPTTIPKGTYKGVDYDVSTMGLSGLLVANKNTSPDLIYEMTKTIWGKSCVGYLTKNNRGLAGLKSANPTEGLVIPLHPGAARYWKEKGIKNMAPAEGSM